VHLLQSLKANNGTLPQIRPSPLPSKSSPIQCTITTLPFVSVESRLMAVIPVLTRLQYAFLHSIISYGVIFGGSSSYANKVFIFQKKFIRIITNTRPRDSCREVFKSREIMTLYSQYIHSLVLYTIYNKRPFDANNEIHKYKTRNNNNLHRPIANLSKFNKAAYISGIKVFNHLPQYIKALTNDHKYFKSTLKRFLYHHSFYSVNEYYEYKEDRRI
jgi:hypothetical protein